MCCVAGVFESRKSTAVERREDKGEGVRGLAIGTIGVGKLRT